MLLERGGRLLMLRRAPNAAYAASLLAPPRGTSSQAKTWLLQLPGRRRKRPASTCSQASCGARWWSIIAAHPGQARLGWFFTAEDGWAGDPVNREPSKHAELVWIDPGAPPPDMVAYTWAGLTAWRSGAQFAVHWQDPGSPVHYDPGYEHELTLLPADPPILQLHREASAR